MGQGPGEAVRVLNPSVFKPCPRHPEERRGEGRRGWGEDRRKGRKRKRIQIIEAQINIYT